MDSSLVCGSEYFRQPALIQISTSMSNMFCHKMYLAVLIAVKRKDLEACVSAYVLEKLLVCFSQGSMAEHPHNLEVPTFLMMEYIKDFEICLNFKEVSQKPKNVKIICPTLC